MKDLIIVLGIIFILIFYTISLPIFLMLSIPFAIIIFICDKIQEIFKR